MNLILTTCIASNRSQTLNAFAIMLFGATQLASAQPASAPPDRNQVQQSSALQADPLLNKTSVTLEDLQVGLQDPNRRDSLIQRHFSRATELTEDQQVEFLRSALQNDSLVVRQQAVEQLKRLELLESVVSEIVDQAGMKAKFSYKSAFALRFKRKPPQGLATDPFIKKLLEDVGSSSPEQRFSAISQLDALGSLAIPGLLKALTDADLAVAAASSLGRAVRGDQADQRLGPMRVGAPAPPAPPAKSHLDSSATQQLVREFAAQEPLAVRVYYGTNRQILDQPPTSDDQLISGTATVAIVVFIGIFAVWHQTRDEQSRRPGCWSVAMWCGLAVAAWWGVGRINAGWQQKHAVHQGVKFGPRRADAGQVHYGYCDVSIPPTHRLGMVERPDFGAEDERRHVVLRRTEMLEHQAFLDAAGQLLSDPKVDGECFVFVHGYNVQFDDAARRTAQIHHDLQFSGLPIFFSWPSRGSFRHYFSDRNEILVSRAAIKQFLSDVAQRTPAKRIHVIAHSMGADAVCQAIADIDAEGQIFEQVILAAPDIDADVFQNQLLPQMQSKAQRTTLYCSRNDLALYASYHFNDSRRAGDSSETVVVAAGLDTVDATDMDTELLGHSYYGNCLPLIRDVREILLKNLPPAKRELEPRETVQHLPYWTFKATRLESASDFQNPASIPASD